MIRQDAKSRGLMTTPSAITFGVMARAPIAGACKTRLGRSIGDAAAGRLYEAMLLDTLAMFATQRTSTFGLPTRRVLLAAPEHDGAALLRRLAPPSWEVVLQRGADLGARLSNALLDLTGDGHLVCLVDSDSPTLPLEALRPLAAPRPDNGVVVGPCEDGGYYLIGVRTPEPRLFEGIPWSTSGVMEATRCACRDRGLPLEELRTWYDIDARKDLDRLDRELRARPELAPRTAEVLLATPLVQPETP